MTDQPKPLESPPPTDSKGEQSLPANQYLNDIDIGCNEVDDLMQQVRTLRNKHKHEGSQPSVQDKQDMLRLFDVMVSKMQDMQKVLRSQCYLPLEAEKRDPDMVTDHSVFSTTATHTDVLPPEVIIPDADNLLTNPPSSVSESQKEVSSTPEKPVLASVEGGQGTPDIPADSKVQDHSVPPVSETTSGSLEVGQLDQKDTDNLQTNPPSSFSEDEEDERPILVAISTQTDPEIEQQTPDMFTGSNVPDVTNQNQEIAEVLPVADSLRSENPIDPSFLGEALHQRYTSEPSTSKCTIKMKNDDDKGCEFTDLPIHVQKHCLKCLHRATFPYFLNAIEDIKCGWKEPQNAHFSGLLTEFMAFLKKARNNKKTKDAYRSFNCNAFIKQKCEKDPDSKKNYLLYETLGGFLSEKKYENSIRDLLYYFSEKKIQDLEPIEKYGNMMQGLEHHFFMDMVDWERFFWEKSLKDYVKRQEAIVRDPTSKVVLKRFTLGKQYPNYKSTVFFRGRILLYSQVTVPSPESYMVKIAYSCLQHFKDDSRVLNSDMFYMETNWTRCEETNTRLEYNVLKEIFSTDKSSLEF